MALGLAVVGGLVALLALGTAERLRAQEAPDPAEATEAAGQSPESAVPEPEDRPSTDQPLPYAVAIEGELPDELREQLEEVSQLIALQERPPNSAAALRRRVRDDVERLESVLRSQSYFDGTVESRVSTDQRPVQVTLTVTPGMEFLLESYTIDYRPADPGPMVPQDAADLDLQIGMRAEAEPIKRAEDRLIRRLGRHGYPYAEITRRRYLVDHERTVMEAEIVVQTGPKVDFGPLAIDGLTDVSEDYLRRILQWPEGTVYDAREMEQVRRRVIETRLFETVLLQPPDDPPGDGVAPVELTLSEAKPRSVTLGAGVTTADDLFLLKAGWEHRNLFGEGEKLSLSAQSSLLVQELGAEFRKPNYLRYDQDLLASASFTNEQSDAYDALSVEAFGGLERRFTENWRGRGGLAFELSEITDQFDSSRFALVGVPLSVTYDSRDNLLNPTEGVELTLGTTPWLNSDNLEDFFIVNETRGSTYWAPFDDDSFVLAARGRFGSIAMADTREVPATQRFYAGGASLRGYQFRSVGPLDADNDPTGGLSVVEVGLDLRFRVMEDYGIVPFIDGGQVYDQRLPDFGQELQWAAGIGLRYYTSIGPLRLDLAFPLNPRPEVDDFFQFYLSIGQAF